MKTTKKKCYVDHPISNIKSNTTASASSSLFLETSPADKESFATVNMVHEMPAQTDGLRLKEMK